MKKTQSDIIFEDIINNYPQGLEYYESVMQLMYREMIHQDFTRPIPRSQVKALIYLLDHCGYQITKKQNLDSQAILKFFQR